MLSAWSIWMIIGIGCVIIEIFDPLFFFISLGIGAILTGLLCLLGGAMNLVVLQIAVFAIFSFVAFLFMRKLGKKLLTNTGEETNVFALKGKTGFVTREIPAEGKGNVKIGGEEWSAVEVNAKPVEMNAKVMVVGVEGNKLIVEKASV